MYSVSSTEFNRAQKVDFEDYYETNVIELLFYMRLIDDRVSIRLGHTHVNHVSNMQSVIPREAVSQRVPS